MATGRDVVRGALVLIGVLAEGETPTAEQLNDGLSTANEMLESWSTEDLHIPSKTKETMTVPSGNGAPTMGPTTGTLDTTRPVEIEKINAKDGSYEFEVELLTFDQWSAIVDKTQTAARPTKAFINYTSPLVTIYLWPVPSANVDLVIYSNKALTSLAAGTTIDAPPGTLRALRYNLAIECAGEFGKPASAEVIKIANESKGNLKRQNKKTPVLVADEMVRSRRTPNIYSGG